jgi:hypothetical protein
MYILFAALTRWLAAPADDARYPIRSLLERAGADRDPREARALRQAALAYLRVVR